MTKILQNKYLKKIRKVTDAQYSKTIYFNETVKRLIETYGTDKIDNSDFLQVGEFTFNLSLTFDDISYSEDNKAIFLMNLFFAEMESEHSISSIKKHFPSFIKMQNKIENIRKNTDCGYIAFADIKDNKILEALEDTDLIFNDFKDLETYINTFDVVVDMLKSFEDEIIKYVSSLKLVILSNTGIQKQHSNGGRAQTILFKSNTNLFKITILSESHQFQSYARLLVKDNSGWSVIQNFNPKTDFNIDISHNDNYTPNQFDKIINTLKDIAIKANDVI